MIAPYVKIVLKTKKDQLQKKFHPWVFSGAIKKVYGQVSEGDIVAVYSNKDEFLGIGHYQEGAIAIRIISFENIDIDYGFWKDRVQKAWNFRKKIGLIDNPETNVFRLIHAEGDGLPGLIVDYYNGTAVFQMHSIGMFLQRESILKALKEVMGEKLKAVYNKSKKTLPTRMEEQVMDGLIYGEPTENVVIEHGIKFKVDWENGQKTGFFIDQRENRMLVQQYAKGRDVLNMFGYTGGFSVYAMKGGANSVHTVDASAKAVELTNENVKLNFSNDERHTAFTADGLEYLKDINEKYDLIILDPPAFAKHRSALAQALKGYKRINKRVFEQIKSGGVLFTFSCSQVVSKEKFREIVFSAAAIAGRKVRVIHQLMQPADHPVNIFHPEGEYLKGLVLYVE